VPCPSVDLLRRVYFPPRFGGWIHHNGAAVIAGIKNRILPETFYGRTIAASHEMGQR
jgi:hypothetical protein